MKKQVVVAIRYNNSIILCIISIARITNKKFSKAIGLAMRYSIYAKSYTY